MALLTSFGLIVAALMLWCDVERKPALKIAASYFGQLPLVPSLMLLRIMSLLLNDWLRLT